MVLVSLVLIMFAGVIGAFGQLNLAIVCLALNSVAVAISPISDMEYVGQSVKHAIMLAIPIVIGFGGVLAGVAKLRSAVHT